MTHSKVYPDAAVPRRAQPSKARQDGLLAYLLMSPALLYLLVVMAVPFLWALYTSFTDKTIGAPAHFIGLQNYLSLLTDPGFWQAVRNTLLFTAGAVIAKVIFGMAMALVLNQNIRFRNFFRVLLFLPWTIPSIVSVFTWQWLYSDVGGVLSDLLMRLHLIESPLPWLASPSLAMFSVILVNVWRGVPFVGIAVLAGLQSISHDQHEAAMIDGAGMLARFRHITLPGVREVTLLTAVITTIWTLNDFEIIWLLTRGGPANATQVLSTLSYTEGFLNLHIGKAIAIAVVTLPALIWLINYVTRRSLSDSNPAH